MPPFALQALSNFTDITLSEITYYNQTLETRTASESSYVCTSLKLQSVCSITISQLGRMGLKVQSKSSVSLKHSKSLSKFKVSLK